MKKFTKVLAVLLIIAIFGAAGYKAAEMSGGFGAFVSNYADNFKNNAQGLADKFNIALPEKEIDEVKTDDESELAEPEVTEEPEATQAPDEEEPQKAEKTNAEVKRNKVVALQDADEMQYALYKDYLVCADKSSLMAYNKSGESEWAVAMSTKQPILKAKGNYILLAERGGKKVCLFVDKKMIYSADTENDIITASLSENGDAVIVTEKPQYKGSVIVYNNKGETVFVWNSGKYDIIDADIEASTRNLAVAVINSEKGVKTCINFFDITKEEPYATPEFDDTLIFDIEFLSGTLNAVADNKLIGLSSRGKEAWTVELGGKTLSNYALEESGFKTIMFDNSSSAELQILDKKGNSRADLKSEGIPNCLDISTGRVAYNNGRELLFGDFTGKTFKSYKTDQDIQDVVILDAGTVVLVYSGSLEFCVF